MDLEPVREELLVAVGAGDLVWQAVLAELIFNDAVGGQHNVSLLQFLNACLPLVAVIHNYLQEQSSTAERLLPWYITTMRNHKQLNAFCHDTQPPIQGLINS